jgi:hypothetical protein
MRKIGFLLLLFFLYAETAKADWPIGKRRTVFLPGYTYFYSASNFDLQRKKNSFPQGNYFVTHVANASIQHGIGRSVDFFTNVPILNLRSINGDSIKTKTGAGDLSFGIAKHFSSKNQHKHFTVKAGVMLPLYQRDTIISLGYASRAIMLEVNYSFSLGKQSFGIVQAAYTHFFDNKDGPQQYNYTGTYGRKLSTFSIATVSFLHQISYSPNIEFNPNIRANTSFTAGRLTLSYGRRITRTIMPMLNFSTVLYGKNAGGGYGLGISFITRLP